MICRFALVIMMAMGSVAFGLDVETVLNIDPSETYPRNSEGDFITLESGRVLFAYTRFTSGGSDFDKADVAMRHSDDGGATWTSEDVVLIENEGDQNTMSISFLRLAGGRIALFYLRKNSREDCRPFLRVSEDEGKSWSAPTACIDRVGYYVVNNDRVVQLPSGRIVIPVAIHAQDGESFSGRGRAACRLSDDGGATWRWSETILEAPEDSRTGLQEPGVVQLSDGRILMFSRTDQGSQYVSYSSDEGETWTDAKPSDLISPVSPATCERLPNGAYAMVYNDHSDVAGEYRGKRTPLTIALSDDGESWSDHTIIEDDPNGWYCYTAFYCTDTHLLLAYCAGDEEVGRLNRTRIVRIPLSQLVR